MGRQIHFYMLPEDRDEFLRHVQARDPVSVVSQGSESPIVRPLEGLDVRTQNDVYLWNRKLLPRLNRKWIPGPRCYGMSVTDLPILEFSGSVLRVWEGRPAIVQGRLYGVFDNKSSEFEKWYEHLARWIRQNYRRNPTSMGGYLGPTGVKLFENGAYLLPQFFPPKTDDWLAEVSKQHPQGPESHP